MLRWRLLFGTLIIALLVGLSWLDGRATIPGVWLLPVLVAFCLLGSAEVLQLAGAAGIRPVAWVVYGGNLLILAANWAPQAWHGLLASTGEATHLGHRGLASPGDWVLLAFGVGVLLAFFAEMSRYRQPGGVTLNLAGAVFALSYLGLMLSFAVQLRLLWGIGALASLLIVVKMGDTGAYAVGRLIGRHPMARVLSPKKTLEGAIGALAFSCVSSWATFRWLVPLATTDAATPAPWWGWIAFGLVIGIVGMLGDLAESMVKRDVQQKDSGAWVPGFGGALDMLDSILLAAPVAYLCWALGIVGR